MGEKRTATPLTLPSWRAMSAVAVGRSVWELTSLVTVRSAMSRVWTASPKAKFSVAAVFGMSMRLRGLHPYA